MTEPILKFDREIYGEQWREEIRQELWPEVRQEVRQEFQSKEDALLKMIKEKGASLAAMKRERDSAIAERDVALMKLQYK